MNDSYEIIQVESHGASFSITTFGGHLLSYKPPQSDDILWVSSCAKTDMSKSIRGGVPVCFPQFGRVHDKASPQHGWARVQNWTLVDQTSNSVTMTLSSSSNQKPGRPDCGMWPADPSCPYTAHLTLTVSLTSLGVLEYVMKVKNSGSVTMPYQLLFHNYFSVKSTDSEFGVTGLEGYSVIDTQPRGREGEGQDYFTQTASPIVVDGEVDRIHHGPGPCSTLINRGEGLGIISLSVTSSPPADVSCVVWNPYVEKAKGMGDFDDEGWKGMICVEPGIINGLTCLGPGKEQVLKQTITLK